MTHLGPYRSNSRPATTIATANTARFTRTAADTADRLQPKSAMTGLNSTPIISRAPAFRNRMTKEAATTYQPKDLVGLALLMGAGTDRRRYAAR